MLGRVRPSSSSLESLEMEREEPFKLTKPDSLSIYEATLAKLREGAQRTLTSITDQDMKIDTDSDPASHQPCSEVMIIDTDMYLSPCSVLSSPDNSRERQNKTITVISMFDRYKTSQNAFRTPNPRVTETKDQTLIDDTDE